MDFLYTLRSEMAAANHTCWWIDVRIKNVHTYMHAWPYTQSHKASHVHTSSTSAIGLEKSSIILAKICTMIQSYSCRHMYQLRKYGSRLSLASGVSDAHTHCIHMQCMAMGLCALAMQHYEDCMGLQPSGSNLQCPSAQLPP